MAAWESAHALLTQIPQKTGPTGFATQSAKALGWNFDHPFHMLDGSGDYVGFGGGTLAQSKYWCLGTYEDMLRRARVLRQFAVHIDRNAPGGQKASKQACLTRFWHEESQTLRRTIPPHQTFPSHYKIFLCHP